MHTLWFFHPFYNTDQNIIVNIHITQTINVKTLDLISSYREMYKKSKPRLENAQNK